MSVREEDKQRNCPNRGLGIAAAAIGVGIGAALYYFFNKREENPDATGSTSSWTCEETLSAIDELIENSSMSTTSDADMDTSSGSSNTTDNSIGSTSTDHETDTEDSEHTSNPSSFGNSSYSTISEHSTSDTSIISTDSFSMSATPLGDLSEVTFNMSDVNSSMEHIFNMSDVNSSMEHIGNFNMEVENTQDVNAIVSPTNSLIFRRFFARFARDNNMVRSTAEIQRLSKIREQAFRDRSWALEECSICFEPMQLSQEVMALPCTHRFHQPCILPWLQERQTCPNCRKNA